MEPTTKRRGRAPKASALSGAERQAKGKIDLERAGGRRLPVNLHAPAASALSAVRMLGGHKTDSAAVEASLLNEAKRLRRLVKPVAHKLSTP